MNFKIPQDLEIEDKIVGPLTMKGLIIAFVGGGIAYWAYMNLDDQTWPAIALPVIVITIAIIFVRIKNMTFLTWLYSLILLFLKPQKRVWRKLSDSPEFTVNLNDIMTAKKLDAKQGIMLSTREDKAKKLKEMRKKLEQEEMNKQ